MANIESVELIVVSDVKSKSKEGSGIKVRLVQWIVDGKAKSVKLEKRSYFKGNQGDNMTGKAEGFSLDDLIALKPFWTKIVELMKNPPAYVPKAAPAQAAPAGDDLDQTPF